MKILFIGDIVGKPGRRAVRELLPKFIAERGIDLVIANGENAAGGFGLTPEIAQELFEDHIDIITSGNHIWDKKGFEDCIGVYDHLLRPANYPDTAPGRGYVLYPKNTGGAVAVVNLMGRVFMPLVDCPFRCIDQLLESIRSKTNMVIVDFHAEATSEKQALAWYLDGRVSAIIGTHTHVQTADERMLPRGTAFISDAGMTGSMDSVLGISVEDATKRFLTGIPYKFEVAKKNVWLQGVLLDVDDATGRSDCIERISIKVKE